MSVFATSQNMHSSSSSSSPHDFNAFFDEATGGGLISFLPVGKSNSDDASGGGGGCKRQFKRQPRRPRTKSLTGQRSIRLGNNGRRLVRSAIAKAMMDRPDLREKCRQVATVKSATVKQLLKMCEIVGVRDVAEDAIRAMDPRIDLEDPKVWDRIMEEDTSYKGNAFITANDEAPHRHGLTDSLLTTTKTTTMNHRFADEQNDRVEDMRPMLDVMSDNSGVGSIAPLNPPHLNIFNSNSLQPQLPLFPSPIEASGLQDTSTSASFTSPTLPSWLSSPMSFGKSEPRGFAASFGLDDDSTSTMLAANFML